MSECLSWVHQGNDMLGVKLSSICAKKIRDSTIDTSDEDDFF